MNHLKYILILAFFPLLMNSCSKLPEEDLRRNLKNQLTENKDFLFLESEGPIKETFVFYPGGLVDPHSYLAWQDQLVSLRPELRVVTVKMPSNLAVLNSQKGTRLFDYFPDSEKWFFAGHSLGGAIATNVVANNQEKIDALIYLAAYPPNDALKEYPGSILSIFATNDGLSTLNDIEERKNLLPAPYDMMDSLDFPSNLVGQTLYFEIKGGNHAQFGNYGEQNGDLTPTITRDHQQDQVVFLINTFINKL